MTEIIQVRIDFTADALRRKFLSRGDGLFALVVLFRGRMTRRLLYVTQAHASFS
jgi:hypothetical protein